MRVDVKILLAKMYERNLNVNRLAAASGLSRATVSNIKCGKTCSQDTLKKIATVLNVEPTELLEVKE